MRFLILAPGTLQIPGIWGQVLPAADPVLSPCAAAFRVCLSALLHLATCFHNLLRRADLSTRCRPRRHLPSGSAQILCTWSLGHPSGPDPIQVSLGPQPMVAWGRQCSASVPEGSGPPAASHACHQPRVCSQREGRAGERTPRETLSLAAGKGARKPGVVRGLPRSPGVLTRLPPPSLRDLFLGL